MDALNHPEARAILMEYGIEAMPPSAHLKPGQTKAVANLQKIVRARGFEHARFVIMIWKETMIRKTVLDASTMWAFSDLILSLERNFPDLVTKDVEKLFAFVDGLHVGWLQQWAKDVEGIIPRRFAIGGMLYERAKRVFGIEQADLLDDRQRRAS
jgi:hypothetical protein